jgi:hypothetical protein
MVMYLTPGGDYGYINLQNAGSIKGYCSKLADNYFDDGFGDEYLVCTVNFETKTTVFYEFTCVKTVVCNTY